MAAFPTIYHHADSTLLHQPLVGDFEDTMALDPTIRSQVDGGYATTRARFTRLPRKWTLRYEWVSQANKNLIKAFEVARRGGSDSFTWTNEEDDTVYTVRFLGLVRYIPHADTNYTRWIVEFILEQV